ERVHADVVLPLRKCAVCKERQLLREKIQLILGDVGTQAGRAGLGEIEIGAGVQELVPAMQVGIGVDHHDRQPRILPLDELQQRQRVLADLQKSDEERCRSKKLGDGLASTFHVRKV